MMSGCIVLSSAIVGVALQHRVAAAYRSYPHTQALAPLGI